MTSFIKGLPGRVWLCLTIITALVIIRLGTRAAQDLPDTSFLPEGTDKIVHAIMYGSLAFCAFCYAYPLDLKRRARVGEPEAFVLFIPLMVGMLDEFLQGFTPGRSQDAFDLMADMTGAVLVLALGLVWRVREIGTLKRRR